MQIYLVRHPQPAIAQGICYGRLDLPLAAPVAAAAQRIRPRLPPNYFLWSSPARRCLQLATALHLYPTVDPRLQEMDFGQWEGQSWDRIGRNALDTWAQNPADFIPPHGESAHQVQQRALAFLTDLPRRYPHDSEPHVLITHAGIMRVLLAWQRRLPPADWCTLQFAYEEILILQLHDFTLT